MNFDDEEEWDLELLAKLVRSEEEAISLRRSTASSLSQPNSLPSHDTVRLPARPSPLASSFNGPPGIKQDELVCDLQQRLLQAEQELSELRQQRAQQSTFVANLALEQELERLHAQILFKDQELLESRRACTEKSEQLRRILAEIEQKRKGSEERKRVKWSAEASGTLKLRGEEKGGCNSKVVDSSIRDVGSQDPQVVEDLWYPPWTLSGPPASTQDGPKNDNRSSPGAHPQLKALATEGPSLVKELQTRVLDNGCTSSSKASNGERVNNGANQFHQGEAASPSNRGNSMERLKEAPRASVRASMDGNDLLRIWCSRNAKEVSQGLVSKLLAGCEADLKLLLSMDTGEVLQCDYPKNRRSSCGAVPFITGSGDERIPGFEVQSLHSFLAKVQVCESALRVVLCILLHDECCQNMVFGRNAFNSQCRNDLRMSEAFVFEDFSVSSSTVHPFKPYLASPRIHLYNRDSSQCPRDKQTTPSEENRSLLMSNTSINGNKSSARGEASWLHLLFEKVLAKAIKGASQDIQTTAMSILVFLVINSQPMRERERYGFVLFDGSIAGLLSVSSGLDVRLQAVRVVHSLLHCPSVLKIFVTEEQVIGGPILTHSEVDPSLQKGKHTSVQAEESRGEDSRRSCVIEVLSGLISCLLHVGSNGQNNQGSSLRRNALRVLTFMATSGHKGAAFLLATPVHSRPQAEKLKSPEDGRSQVLMSGTLPVHLITLLDQELNAEEEVIASGQGEERDYVIHETVTLLCRLVSHSTQSSMALSALTAEKGMARMSISVANRLISRGALPHTPTGRSQGISSSVNLVDLCLGLRRRLLASISNL